MNKYYFDTSIWIDFLENRNEPGFPKGEIARDLILKIIGERDKIIYSDLVVLEFRNIGYPEIEIEELFNKLSSILIYVEATDKQLGKGKDIAAKRNLPKGDAIHAIIARDNNAKLVSWDNHFKKLIDIVKPFNPKELL